MGAVSDAGDLGAAVAGRLDAVRRRMHEAAGPRTAAVRIVAVTKGFGPEAVAAARAAGLDDIGENYAPELLDKWCAGPTWHFLGAVQRNKVKALAGKVGLWQSVDRVAAGAEIARRAPGAAVLVQVNLAADPNRNGCSFGEAPALVGALRDEGLDVRGLMGVAPEGPPDTVARPLFRRLAELSADLGLDELSMGMTGDLEVAVQEGATMVRLGTALFGPRPPRRGTRRLGSAQEASSG